jgi:hypothetical protein
MAHFNNLEFNSDTLLDLVEKNYQNLVDTLTNNAIDTAIAAGSSPFNPILSLLQSSLTFPSLSNQSDNSTK